MRIGAAILVSALVASCAAPSPVTRSEALVIAGELVARQRLERAKPEHSDNEPNLLVTDVLAVDGCDDLAVALCEYRGLGQGYALLVKRRVYPPETLLMFGGNQYERVESVTFRRTPDGTVIAVKYATLRGRDAGHEELLVRPDSSCQWLRKRR